jgi:oxygen-independent coproporphyrinogen-3 oxidase
VEDYQARVMSGELPIVNGHLLNIEDEIIRNLILELMCKGSTIVPENKLEQTYVENVFKQLQNLEKDNLVHIENCKITVTQKGNSFIRNICACLDAKLMQKKNTGDTFSRAI